MSIADELALACDPRVPAREEWRENVFRRAVEALRAAEKQSLGARLIAAERQRQIEREGWTAEHDDEHDACELTRAAAGYADAAVNIIATLQWALHDGPTHVRRRYSEPALSETLAELADDAKDPLGAHYGRGEDGTPNPPHHSWPWARSWWKPSADPVRNLEKAGALIAAEIDRLLRKAERVRPSAAPRKPLIGCPDCWSAAERSET